jgi:hypothetical protein
LINDAAEHARRLNPQADTDRLATIRTSFEHTTHPDWRDTTDMGWLLGRVDQLTAERDTHQSGREQLRAISRDHRGERDRYRLAWQSARRRAEAWRGDYVTVATDLHRRDEQWMGRAYHDRIVAALKREHKAALGRSRLGKRLAEAEATIARIREYCDLTPVLPAQAVVQLLDGASVAEVIIARSSLGSPEVQAIAALTPPEDVAEIMRRVREIEGETP